MTDESPLRWLFVITPSAWSCCRIKEIWLSCSRVEMPINSAKNFGCKLLRVAMACEAACGPAGAPAELTDPSCPVTGCGLPVSDRLASVLLPSVSFVVIKEFMCLITCIDYVKIDKQKLDGGHIGRA